MPIEFEVKVALVGNSLRMTIPKELCKALNIVKGSKVGLRLSSDETEACFWKIE